MTWIATVVKNIHLEALDIDLDYDRLMRTLLHAYSASNGHVGGLSST